jgi:hypothetical protein
MLISMVLVVVSLVLGIAFMTKGGEANKKYGNKLMRMRVTLQGLALGFFILAVWTQNSE